ncbi:EamA/RhaT family transporter [Mucilaginibacter sp. RS28]|uniref:EamA/RhaT family transporter n=1 Tax=Mucilaginibacter straminoryzae TaxID=2932774 RepID=A0A9X1X532_9SPHI|nr:EamA/RhaT family transporter [Mucilaginibacter straminoryzae]MCJ8211136.1 EamA/RhaT family transporter [Mucilaginibacter straminoryzae]
MIYILLSICCSVIVSVMLKLAKRYSIDIFQAITWNYSVAIILTAIFLKPQLSNLTDAPVYTYSLLGVLLPALFVIIGASVRFMGIVRTDTAQRISLVIPLIAAFLFFGEAFTPVKFAGIAVGFVAMGLLLFRSHAPVAETKVTFPWLYPLLVFAGFGVIDILFKKLSQTTSITFGTSLFLVYVLAFVLSLAVLIYLVLIKKAKFLWMHILFGWMLGVANFGNILFYLLAHRALAHNPSLVFTTMNIGVITLGTLVGTIVFKEKTTWLNRIGIILAIIAVIIITYA